MASAGKVVVAGGLAGLSGAAAMAVTARLEQLLSHRPSSYVPAHTLAHLLGLPKPDQDRVARNLVMHFGTGAIAGVLRAVMAVSNLRGPWASAMHANVRLSIDQTLENATGVGAPPWTWPRDELIIDLLHKTVYAFVTGRSPIACCRRRRAARRGASGSARVCPAMPSGAAAACQATTRSCWSEGSLTPSTSMPASRPLRRNSMWPSWMRCPGTSRGTPGG